MTMSYDGDVLPAEVHVPANAGDGVSVLVLLHGRGADRTDLFSLRRYLPEAWAVVAPDAPYAAAPWGYGPGRAWYRYLGRNRPEPESYDGSLAAVHMLLDRLPETLGVQPGVIALGGFSQGGVVSMGYALSHPGRARNVLNFSGFLADHPAVDATPDNVRGMRFFWGHGTGDPAIPFDLAIEGREQLRRAGADLDARDYSMGHGISPDELNDAVAWLEAGRHRESSS